MVTFFRIIFDAFWELANIKIPIDDGYYVTPWSIIVFSLVLGLIVGAIKNRSEKNES